MFPRAARWYSRVPDGASSSPDQSHSSGTNPMGRNYRYLGVTLDKRLSWSPHIVQVRKKIAQRVGMLGPLRNRKSDLRQERSVANKQLIRPMMDYACPAWRSAARTRVRRLQVLQSKCLRLATGAPHLELWLGLVTLRKYTYHDSCIFAYWDAA